MDSLTKADTDTLRANCCRSRFPDFITRINSVNQSQKDRGAEFPYILVPPFNAIGPEQILQLSNYFKVICGGPETARFTGRLTGPVAVHDLMVFSIILPLLRKCRFDSAVRGIKDTYLFKRFCVFYCSLYGRGQR